MWLFTPVEVFVTWPFPNYKNPQKRGPEVWVFSSIFFALATFCVGFRFYVRLFVRKWFGPDDYLVLLGYVSSVAVTILAGIAFEKYGWDIHLYDLAQNRYTTSSKVLFYSRIIWGTAASTTRLSVLCLYYRLLTSARAPRGFFWVNHVLTVSTIFTFLWYLLFGIFVCQPISAYWSFPNRPGDHCWNDGMGMLATAIINTIQEFATATLPVIAVYALKVKKEQRWAVIGVLSLGYSIVIAGICRTYYINKIATTWDPTWWAAPHWICSEVENYLALICACAPPLRPVIGRLFHRVQVSSFQLHAPARLWFGKLSSQTTSADPTVAPRGGIQTADEWVTAMSRTIDLEGIAVDDYGYRVEISGPSEADRRVLAHERRRTKLRRRKRALSIMRPIVPDKAVFDDMPKAIAAKTEVTIDVKLS